MKRHAPVALLESLAEAVDVYEVMFTHEREQSRHWPEKVLPLLQAYRAAVAPPKPRTEAEVDQAIGHLVRYAGRSYGGGRHPEAIELHGIRHEILALLDEKTAPPEPPPGRARCLVLTCDDLAALGSNHCPGHSPAAIPPERYACFCGAEFPTSWERAKHWEGCEPFKTGERSPDPDPSCPDCSRPMARVAGPHPGWTCVNCNAAGDPEEDHPLPDPCGCEEAEELKEQLEKFRAELDATRIESAGRGRRLKRITEITRFGSSGNGRDTQQDLLNIFALAVEAGG